MKKALLTLQLSTILFDALFKKIGLYADKFAANIKAFGETALGSAAKSVNAMLVGLGGHAIGDIAEFLNMSYEPIKKGFQTGDWSDLGRTAIQYGASAVVSAVLVVGSIAATAAIVGAFSAAAAPIAAGFVAAGWAAYGLYDAVTNGAELIGKIVADLASVIPKIGDMIERGLAAGKEAIKLMIEVIKPAFSRISKSRILMLS